jgi:hypothetical protein
MRSVRDEEQELLLQADADAAAAQERLQVPNRALLFAKEP